MIGVDGGKTAVEDYDNNKFKLQELFELADLKPTGFLFLFL